jgi:WD40 repeat protein
VDPVTGAVLEELPGPPVPVTALEVHADRVVTGDHDGNLQVRPRSGTDVEWVGVEEPLLPVDGIGVSKSGKWISLLLADGTEMDWRMGRRPRIVKAEDWVREGAWSQSGGLEVVAARQDRQGNQAWLAPLRDRDLEVRDDSGKVLSRIPAHRGRVLDVAARPDVEGVVTVGLGGDVIWWRLAGEHLVLERRLDVSYWVDDRLTRDEGTLACFPLLARAAWQVWAQGLPRQFFFHTAAALNLPTGLVALGGTDGEVRLVDLSTRRELARLPGHRYGVSQLRFSGDGQRLVSAGRDGTVLVRDLSGLR